MEGSQELLESGMREAKGASRTITFLASMDLEETFEEGVGYLSIAKRRKDPSNGTLRENITIWISSESFKC